MSASSPPTPQLRARSANTWLWTAFSLFAISTIALFFIPAFIIRPFSHQSPRPLLLAMALRQRAPLATLVTALACFALAYALWKAVGWWRRSLLLLIMLLVTFSAVMARQNYFEWMFHPIASAQFIAQSDSKLDPKEMILAVGLRNDARAYPISQMAYHHVLNEVVAGVPIVVTY